MPESSHPFEFYQSRVDRVYELAPGEGKPQVLLSRLFFHSFKTLEQDYNKTLAPFDLNVTTWAALMMLYSADDGEVNPSCISQTMSLSRTNITRVADELVMKGWVSRTPALDDRRKISLKLTLSGVAQVERLLPVMRAHTLSLWSVLDPSEQNSLRKILLKLSQSKP